MSAAVQPATSSDIDGFDPLQENVDTRSDRSGMFEEATKRVISNILKSYTGYFDIFSEMIQNALDAIDARLMHDQSFKGFVRISIDLSAGKVSVTDNGIGMDEEQFRYCFRPSVSFKKRREGRGHKGVGATFLAYGFSLIRLQSKQNNQTISATLRNGRQWAEDAVGSYKRPVFEASNFDCKDLLGEISGTSIEAVIGTGQRPQLTWLQASNAKQWVDVLRIRTPLGGVYLSAKERKQAVNVVVDVTDMTGIKTSEQSSNVDYFYPHEMDVLSKVKSVIEIERKILSMTGDLEQRMKRLPDEFKRLDAVWEVWTKDQIISHSVLARNLADDDKTLIQNTMWLFMGALLALQAHGAVSRMRS